MTHFYTLGDVAQNLYGWQTHIGPVFLKHSPGYIMICGTTWLGGQKEVNLACGIQAVYIYFNWTGIWGGETIIIINDSRNSATEITK